MTEWKTLQEMTLLGEDTKTKEFSFPGAKEVMLVFYGRTNDIEDSKTSGYSGESVAVNDTRLFIGNFTYIKPKNSRFYTVLRIFTNNGWIDGTVAPKGNTSIYGFNNLGHGNQINTVAINTNGLFKSDSEIAVFYR